MKTVEKGTGSNKIRTQLRSNPSSFQSIKIDNTKMGKTAERNEEFRKKELHRSFRKTNPKKLKAYVTKPPAIYQWEMVEAFECSENGIRYALRRGKITQKKTTGYIEQDQQKVAAYFVGEGISAAALLLLFYEQVLSFISKGWHFSLVCKYFKKL